MARQGFTTARQVEQYFEERVLQMAALAGRSYIIWQVLCVPQASARIVKCFFFAYLRHVRARARTRACVCVCGCVCVCVCVCAARVCM